MKQQLAAFAAAALVLGSIPKASVGVCAEEAAMPIPATYGETVAFLNAYGHTYVEGNRIYACVDLSDWMTLTYDFSTEGSTAAFTTLSQESYKMDDMDDGWYHEMLAIEVLSPGDITLTWYEYNWLNETTTIAYQYTFTVDAQLQVTQTDLFAFVPDGYTEAEKFAEAYGNVSIWGDKIVFCDKCHIDGGYTYTQEAALASSAYCVLWEENVTNVHEELVAGDSVYYVQVIQPEETGYLQLRWSHGRDWEDTPTKTTLRTFRVSPTSADITDVTETLGAFLPGDGTGDGQVTMTDAVALQKWLLGIEAPPQWIPLDLNADQRLDAIDLQKLHTALVADRD